MKITRNYLKQVIKEEINSLLESKEELELVAQELQGKFNFQKTLEAAYQKAPDKPTAIEKQKFNEIVQPYFNEVDQMHAEFDKLSDAVQTPEDFRTKIKPFLAGKFREIVKKSTPVNNKFFWEVKNAGAILSKPYIKMMIDFNKKDVERLQQRMQQLDQYNVM